MTAPQQIERAIGTVTDQTTLVQKLLVDALGWPIAEKTSLFSELGYGWTEAELRAQGIEKKLEGQVLQLQLRDKQPWGIFAIEFADAKVYKTVLRKVLRGLVPNRRREASLPAWKHQDLLFLCTTKDYENFTFAHFRGDNAQTARLTTFGWSPGDRHVRTLCEFNLPALAWPDDDGKDPDGWLEKWTVAFDVEAVTKRFFKEYAKVFADVEKKATDVPAGDARRLYTQRLFNRLLFLYFIQRKGWLEFAGKKNYLRALFDTAVINTESYLNDRLWWAFFYGLNTAGENEEVHTDEDLVAKRGTVPFLNGGLFDLENQFDKHEAVAIPNAAFGEILELFERYNFTVTESTPLDVEVAVDPEMLGKVFEELVTGRHESGSYYTPRPIVAFMCREALKHFLAPVANDETAVARFVDDGDPSGFKAPEDILAALKRVKVCDPACGSGAYLLGMMQELLRLRDALFAAHQLDYEKVYDRKLEIIQNNLYGVDLDLFAVNIAKLRLWLSLAVDHHGTSKRTLPNLDFKIECGDSLTAPNPQDMSDMFRNAIVELADELAEMKAKFIGSHGAEKKKLSAEIKKLESHLRQKLPDPSPDKSIDWRVDFADVTKANGFDIVIANPPYVRKENIPDSIKPTLKANFGGAISGRSDLYCSFFSRGMQLLRSGGVHVFVCSNAWLDAGYGSDLQDYLLNTSHILSIYESAIEKQFSTANVNTAISILQKKPTANGKPVRFVQFTSPLLQDMKSVACTETEIDQTVLRNYGMTGRSYTGNKWGGKYLRAPEIYKRIFGELAEKFVLLSNMAKVSGYIHDNNTGSDWPKKMVVWSLKSASRIRVTEDAKGISRIGVSPRGNSTEFSPILFARTFGTRHLVLLAEAEILGKEFYKITPTRAASTDSIVLQLNSTLGIIQREILGIRGLGGGAIKFAAADVAQFQLLPSLDSLLCKSHLAVFANRDIKDIDEELYMEDRIEVDSMMFDVLGLTTSERKAVYRAAFSLVDSRRARAKSTGTMVL